ncbi:MAG TPA: hypothetical protein VHM23_01385 [Actinomycetota bacterium]|nr:hypothetical protein [Actinomycetota bacterium]
MSITSPTLAPTIEDHTTADHHLDRMPPWFWALVEALAHAGAAFDPAAALAARRLANIRE